MSLLIRPAAAALAAAFLANSILSVQSTDPPSLQKCPIGISESVLLPANCPVESWAGVPTVVVSIGESRVERAAIATGLNANVISPEASRRLKLSGVTGTVKVDVLDASAADGLAEVERFKVSTLELLKLTFVVADVPGMLSLRPHPDAPAAWLGTPFLSAFQVTLDPAARSLTLKKTTTPLPHSRGTSIVPLVLRDNRPYVTVAIPGAKPFLALIDTTAALTVIPTNVAESLKLKPLRVETISRIEGKTGKAAFAELPKLSIGKAEWKAARVFYLTSESSKEYDRKFAVVGMDFIRQFKVTMDFAHAKLALGPPEKPAEHTPSDEAPSS